MDHVFFLSREEWKNARELNHYDLIVVGTGFCALAVASRALKNDPFTRILLIERGSFFLPEHFQNLPGPFVKTLGGLSETFPWTLAHSTQSGQDGTVRWQHGMVPFFGGRSTLWSSWCPRPTDEELDGWPTRTIAAMKANFDEAERLLHVQGADEIDRDRSDHECDLVVNIRPVYGKLQRRVETLLANDFRLAPGVYRTEAARMASSAGSIDGIDFQKFAVPGALLDLVIAQADADARAQGAPLHIVADCTVERIVQQGGHATALQTSRGVLPLGDAKLVLAMGTLPPTTLLRNSFPQLEHIGARFSAHFITSIVARVPREDLDPHDTFRPLEIGASYVAGVDAGDFKRQFHVQLTALHDRDPRKNAGRALRYMPDVVATASKEQLASSTEHVVFVCAVLGELDYRTPDNRFVENPPDPDPTTNSLLRVRSDGEGDVATWNAMDVATIAMLEQILSPKGPERVEYWYEKDGSFGWHAGAPPVEQRRVDALVHESSTLHLGDEAEAPVGIDYRVKGTDNVYVTGGGLWPQGGSWNPTLAMVALALDLADRLVRRRKG